MNKKKEVIQTERLTLSAFKKSDKEEAVKIFFDESVKKTYMIPDYTSVAQAEALFERMKAYSESEDHFLYAIRLEGKLIGFLNDTEIKDGSIEIGYVISPGYQRKGYMTEAFKACIEELFSLGFHEVRAGFFIENIASRRVMEKCGMKPTGEEDMIEYKGIMHRCAYYSIKN